MLPWAVELSLRSSETDWGVKVREEDDEGGEGGGEKVEGWEMGFFLGLRGALGL